MKKLTVCFDKKICSVLWGRLEEDVIIVATLKLQSEAISKAYSLSHLSWPRIILRTVLAVSGKELFLLVFIGGRRRFDTRV